LAIALPTLGRISIRFGVVVFLLRAFFGGGFGFRLFYFDLRLVRQTVRSLAHHHFAGLKTGDDLDLLPGLDAGFHVAAAGLVL